MIWTKEEIDFLDKITAEGKLIARQIAEIMERQFKRPFSKGAIVSKMHRLGIHNRLAGPKPVFTGRKPEPQPKKAPASRSRVTLKPPAKQIALPPFYDPQGGEQITAKVEHRGQVRGVVAAINALQFDNCRWPIGEVSSDDFHFCCRPRVPGYSYCSEHLAKSAKRKGDVDDLSTADCAVAH